jgi:hypothetical protein
VFHSIGGKGDVSGSGFALGQDFGTTMKKKQRNE